MLPRSDARAAVVVVVAVDFAAVVAVVAAAVTAAVAVAAVIAEEVSAVAGVVGADVAAAAGTLASMATAIGEAWAHEAVRTLRSQERQVVGAWPGTMREARMRVLSGMQTKLDAQQLEELARVANLAARRGWHEVSEPDLEP